MEPKFQIGDEVLLVPRDNGRFLYGVHQLAGHVGKILEVNTYEDDNGEIYYSYEVTTKGNLWGFTFIEYDIQPTQPRTNKEAVRLLIL